jgi:hypothetical protein
MEIIMSAVTTTGFQIGAPAENKLGPAVAVSSERGALGTVYKLFTGKELIRDKVDLLMIDPSKLVRSSKYGTFNLNVLESIE